MSNTFRYMIAVAAVLLAVLVAAPACQCDSVEPITKIEHDVTVAPAEYQQTMRVGTKLFLILFRL